jgi:4-diphosphocytidyl-2-C-methyl-D-erythritol kinase
VKKIPLAAGLGGGSGNAATTLLGLNELFGQPLSTEQLHPLAVQLGSDVPFFLQSRPALATGRGERVIPLEPFPALRAVCMLLIHPGFGISTAWAYQQLGKYPEALNGRPGRAQELMARLQASNLQPAAELFYNALEAPAYAKYPILALFQEFLREQGAVAALMSGSGSATFALVENQMIAERLRDQFKARFGKRNWMEIVSL